MRVLGLDPGSRKLGWGLLESSAGRWRRVASGTVHLPVQRPLPERLQIIHVEVSSLLALHTPELVAIEECFVARSPKAALVLGEVRGVLLLAVQQAGLALEEFAPRAVKLSAVGHGGAAKEQVQYMIPRLLLECPASLAEDEADALAVAWCGALHLRTGASVAHSAAAPRLS